MRSIKCKQCGKNFNENDGNPAIHYSTPVELCMHCECFNKLKDGDWYQQANGEYVRKGVSIEDTRHVEFLNIVLEVLRNGNSSEVEEMVRGKLDEYKWNK